MRPTLLDYLACPRCAGDLRATPEAADGGAIESGELRCVAGHAFPVVRGVPRFADAGGSARTVADTVRGFGYEWTHEAASRLREHDQEQFLDWVAPLGVEDFRGRAVLDAGCGMGRWAACVARAGARAVVAVDLGDAVESAQANLRPFPNAHVVQADIFHLPVRRAFDVAYSIGVLHHTPAPEQAFASVVSRVVPGGRVCAWVYGREGNGWLVWLVDPVRKGVTSRLPRPVLWGLSTLLALPLHGLLRLAFRREPGGATRARLPLPYRAYLGWLARYDFRHNRAVVFDHLVPRIAFYIQGDEFRSWFTRRGITAPVITSRNGNSWRGLGVVP